MLQNTKAQKYSYGILESADFKAKIKANVLSGLQLDLDGNEIHAQLIGQFNAYNLLAIYATAILLGEDKEEVLIALSALKTAPGRFEQMHGPENKMALVDYAHTPDALENVLKPFKPFVKNTNASLRSLVAEEIAMRGKDLSWQL